MYGFKVSFQDNFSKPLRQAAGSAKRSLADLVRGEKQVEDGARKMGQGMQSAGDMMRRAIAGIGMASLARQIVYTTGKFEKYEAVIRNATGSHVVAARSIQMISDFAKDTPYQIDELTESFVKLSGRGILAGKKDMNSIGDVAASLGKDFLQLTEAMLDINNTERWTELGIKAKTVGDKVSLTFRGQTVTVARTERGVLSAITAFSKLEGVQGTMAAIAQTTEGQLSNLADSATMTAVAYGQELRPAIQVVLKTLSSGLKYITDNRREIVAIVSSVGSGIAVFWGLSKAIIGVRALLVGMPALLSAAMSINPVVAIAGAVAGLGVLLYNTNRHFQDMIDRLIGIKREAWAIRALSDDPKLRLAQARQRLAAAEAILQRGRNNMTGSEWKDATIDAQALRKEIGRLNKEGSLAMLVGDRITPEGKLAPWAQAEQASAKMLGGGAVDSAVNVGGDKIVTRNVTLNINHLVENFTVSTTNVQESSSRLKTLFAEWLRDAAADSLIITGQ